MIKFTPSIGFTGQCAQAIELYEKAFGARIKEKVLFSDGVDGFKCKNGEENYIFYCEMFIGEQIIALADDSMGILNEESRGGNSHQVNLLIHFDSVADLKVAYEILVDGGKVLSPIGSTSYCSAYTVLEDKFGICWELMSGYPS